MSAADISRSSTEPEKRYDGVRLQQGRVNTDDDFNEHAALEAERTRATLLDVVGAVGSPNAGFQLANLRQSGSDFDFDLLAGSFYLGGLRLDAFPAAGDVADTYAEQDDWLSMPAGERAVPGRELVQLAYLEVWQQPVSAVEDEELFEHALGGPDTSTRVRTMRRVRLAEVSADDCAGAWQELVSRWAAAEGDLDDAGELVADARLTVSYADTGTAEDLCSPTSQGGYLGAENQAIRVQLADAGHLTWGFDNAAPLYRIEVLDATTLRLDTEPVDQAHWPIAGQTVEILLAGAVLVNGERLAETSGHLARLAGSYDPVARTVTLAAGDAFPGTPTTAFLRVWNRGDDLASPARIPFSPGTPVALGHTGLLVDLAGRHLRRGDHWIIAARPETPRKVVPWSLERGRRPHGFRRFVAPLGLIAWRSDGQGFRGEITHDCRPHFQPLTARQTCCTYTVGNGVQGRGRFTSVQAAIDALPRAGGKICVLPGDYHESVVVRGRSHVIIEGCGERSRLIGDGKRDAVVLVEASQHVTLRGLAVLAETQIGVLIDGRVRPDPEPVPLAGDSILRASSRLAAAYRLATQRILLEELTIRTRDLSGVAAHAARFLTLRRNHIQADTLADSIGGGAAGRWPAVYLEADDVLVEENHVEAAAEPIVKDPERIFVPTYTRTAMGGVQLAGGSERVELRRNHIVGGNGAGVLLGSFAWVPEKEIDLTLKDWGQLLLRWRIALPGWHFHLNEEGCIEIVWDPPPPADDPDGPLVPVSMGALADIRIVDNTIERMGGAGVGVARFFDFGRREELITVDRLTIEGNRIRGCLRLPLPTVPSQLLDLVGSGAITFADGDDLLVRDNHIEGNGRRHVDPVCGVFALRAAGAVFERNRIVDNAPRVVTSEPVRPGLRGGIVVMNATSPVELVETGETREVRSRGLPALKVHDNVIVVPEGRALLVAGSGRMVFSDNQLTSQGPGLADYRPTTTPGLATNTGATTRLAAASKLRLAQIVDLLGGCVALVLDVTRAKAFTARQPISYRTYRSAELMAQAQAPVPLPVNPGEGSLVFHDTQATLDLRGAPTNLVLSSVLLASYDDVSVMGNQLACLQEEDLVLTNLAALGFSARVSDNRFSESFFVGGLSAITYAIVNTTTDNQATHCMLVAGSLKINRDNIILLASGGSDLCGGVGTVVNKLNEKYLGRLETAS